MPRNSAAGGTTLVTICMLSILIVSGLVLLRLRPSTCVKVGVIAATLVIPLAAIAAPSTTTRVESSAFLRSIVGDWVGTCEQTTDKEKPEHKYFRAVVKETKPNTFESKFECYRIDARTGSQVGAGESTVVTTISGDGVTYSKVTGTGSVLFCGSRKDQRHEIVETVKTAADNSLEATGSGSIKVSGMPMGLGKNGKASSTASSWSIKNGLLTVKQNLKVAFRALCFTKKFNVECRYTARRGSDLAGFIAKNGMSAAAGR